MKVKVGNRIYDGAKEPVMVILDEWDKGNISRMLPEDSKYCQFPDSMDPKDIEEWMSAGTRVEANETKIDRELQKQRKRLRKLLEIRGNSLKPIYVPKDFTPPRYDDDYYEMMAILDKDE